jgi:DNA-binding LytR/AlgR family response regulator
MKKWKCLIVDDDPPSIITLKSYIEALENIKVVGTCSNTTDASEFLNDGKVNLMFLDINMSKLLGAQLLLTHKRPPKVIFTTGHKDYAYEAFELNAVDYLLKPISFERFLKAVKKLCPNSDNEPVQYGHETGFLYFKADRKMVKVHLKSITYIESFKDYVVIHRQNETDLKVKYSISSMENMLPQNLFIRIHRSYLVSVKKVTAFTNHDVEVGKIELPIGKSYPDVFKKLTGPMITHQNPE